MRICVEGVACYVLSIARFVGCFWIRHLSNTATLYATPEFFFTPHWAENKATVATVRNLIEKNFGIYLDCIR